MNKYRISVLMGIYNCAPTLQEALDSLYAQTFQDFKIILCDDGSKDDTFAIAERNAKEHPDKVVVIKNERNMGLNYTLNHCLEYADTEYCARMDGDDISMLERFAKEIQFLDEHQEYAIVSCGMTYFDEGGVFGKSSLANIVPTKETFVRDTPHCHAPCMVRTEAYKAVGGYTVDRRLLRNEDYNLWMKMYAAGYRGYNLPEYLYAMRDDRNATARRNFRCRINSIYSVTLAYKTLHFSFCGYARNVIEQIIKIIAPTFVYNYFHKKRIKRVNGLNKDFSNLTKKIIHYVWLGGGKLPASVKSSISTWKKYCPDWEIVRWNETNFDINKYTWVHEAIAQKKYAFAADFIRLYVLYNYGGIYVDTDVDFLRPIEGSLCHRFACGIQIPIVESKESIYNRKSLQTGFLYSEKGHPFLSVAMHDLYDNGNRHFVKANGNMDMMPIDVKLMDVLKKSFGANPVDKDQLLRDDIMLYNSSVYATRKTKNKDSYIVHWFDQSWTDAHGIVPKLKRFIKKYLYFLYRKQ